MLKTILSLTEILRVKCPYCKKYENYNCLYDCEYDAIVCKLCHKRFRYDFSQGKDVIKDQNA